MPQANIGQKTALDKTNIFISLKAQGEKVTFRLAQGTYSYDGKHFTKTAEGWAIGYCPRIMSEEPCNLCQRYFEINKGVKKLKEENAPAGEISEAEKESNLYKPKITFYYAILNRDLKQAQILKATLSTRLKFDELQENGVDVMGSDFILTRTEKPGADYYSLIRKDSKDSPEIYEEELNEFGKAQVFNIDELAVSKKGSGDLAKTEEEEDEK